jgi:hypothetical protein
MIILRNKAVMYSDSLEEREFVNPYGEHYNEGTNQMVRYQSNGKVQTRPASMQEMMRYRQKRKLLAAQEKAGEQNIMKSAVPSSQMATGITGKSTGILNMAKKNTGILSMAKKRL